MAPKKSAKTARILGTLRAKNGPLSLVVADFAVASAWRGGATAGKDGKFPIGALDGVRVTIGARSGASLVVGPVGTYGAIRLCDVSGPIGVAKRDEALAERIAQWPVWSMPKTVGKFIVPTSLVALMLPHRDGTFPDRNHSAALAGKAVFDGAERALIPVSMGPGIYEVARYPCRPVKGRGPYQDDLGEYGDVIEISYCDRLPKKFAGLVP